jgi:heme O synthase-like polyprenyltransferase
MAITGMRALEHVGASLSQASSAVYGENADRWAAATSVRTAVRLSLKSIVQPVSSLSLPLALSLVTSSFFLLTCWTYLLFFGAIL